MFEILIGLVCFVIIVSLSFAHLLDEHRWKIEELDKKIDGIYTTTVLRISTVGTTRTEAWTSVYRWDSVFPVGHSVWNRELSNDEVDAVLDNWPVHYLTEEEKSTD